MFWIIGLCLIIIGLYFLISGIFEKDRYLIQQMDKPEKILEEQPEEIIEELKKPRKEIKGAGVLLIGPIPIVFGESKFAVYALILAIVLMLLSIIVMFGI